MVFEGDEASAVAGLAEMDKEILRLVSEGRTSKEIGRALNRSPYTIDDRLKKVCRDLGADTRAHAAAMLLRQTATTLPRDLGGAPRGGIEAGQATLSHAREDGGSRDGSGHGRKGLVSEIGRLRLGRVTARMLAVLVGVAAAAYLLANAIVAVQQVFLNVLRG